jgi:hypothetical protein
MVAGTAVLLLEQNPSWIPYEAKSKLVDTAVNLGLATCEQGFGEIRL